jgi:hypothetical protein
MNIPSEQYGVDILFSNDVDGEDYSELIDHLWSCATLDSLQIVHEYPAEGDTTVETLCTAGGVMFPVAFEYRSHGNVAEIEKAENGDAEALLDIYREMLSFTPEDEEEED